ncbi:MAG: hypothetical protein ACREDR_18285 [Blastocatellia bacterium]
MKTNQRMSLLAVLLVFASVASAQQTGAPKKKVPAMSSDDMAGNASTQASSEAAATGDVPAGWTRYSLEGCGLSIALQGEPVASDMALPAGAKELAISAKNYNYLGAGYGVAIAHVLSSVAFPIKPFAEGIMKGISGTPSVSNLQYSIAAGKSATSVQITGTWQQAGVLLAFEGFAEVRGPHAWSVLAIHQASNQAAGNQGRKAFASAKFDGPECPNR